MGDVLKSLHCSEMLTFLLNSSVTFGSVDCRWCHPVDVFDKYSSCKILQLVVRRQALP